MFLRCSYPFPGTLAPSDYSWIIPPKYVVHWTMIIVMSGADDLGFDEMEERVDRYVDNGQGGSG